MKCLTVARNIATGLATLLVVAGAIAGIATRKTKITIQEPVRVPGATLAAGTYYFQIPHVTSRTVVRITDQSGKLVTQFMGVTYNARKRDHDVMLFGSHECGTKAIKSWFYPGNDIGIRFVYPEEEAALIAASCDEAVPEIHENRPEDSQLQGYSIHVVTPKGQEQEYKPEALSASDQVDRNGFDADASGQNEK